jgi:hypothetical protein
MARFTTRVQLNGNATWEHYEKLHSAMKANGFSQTITDTAGAEYSLPHAEYNRDAELTRDDVLKSAKQAAGLIWNDFSILVTESAGRTWENLKKIP